MAPGSGPQLWNFDADDEPGGAPRTFAAGDGIPEEKWVINDPLRTETWKAKIPRSEGRSIVYAAARAE